MAERLIPQNRPGSSISPEQLKRLHTLWAKLCQQAHIDPRDRGARLGWFTGAVGRPVHSSKQLTREEAMGLINEVQKHLPAELLTKRRRRGGREISQARGTAGRKGQPASKEIILPGAEDFAKLDAVLRRLEMDQQRLAAFLRAPSSPLRGRDKIYSLADLNEVLWALEGIERRAKRAKSSTLNVQRSNVPSREAEEVAAT